MHGTSRCNFPMVCANLEHEMEDCQATGSDERRMDAVQLHRRSSSPKWNIAPSFPSPDSTFLGKIYSTPQRVRLNGSELYGTSYFS